MRILLTLLALWGLAWSQPASTTPPPDFPPQVFEIAKQLRCPVCRGESAGESNAGIAVEMRRIIAEQLDQGKTPEQIRAYFVSRYGDWILFEPPRRGLTLWVWLAPVLGVGVIGLALWGYLQQVRRRARELPEVADADLQRLEAELEKP